MISQIDLRELASLHGTERAWLSLYLGGEASGEAFRRERSRRIRELLEDEPAELEHFEQNLQRIEAWLADRPEPREVCVFACWAEDRLLGYTLDGELEVPDVMRVGASPYVRPLANLQDEYETFVVVLADNTATRIVVVDSAVPEEHDTIRGKVKNRVRKGGWSQKRYARRREKQLDQYAGDIAGALVELQRDESFERLVLMGSDETLQALHAALPQNLQERIIAEESADLGADDRELMREAFACMFEAERESEAERWRRIKDEYLGGDLAAVGADDVVRAAMVGQVELMLVTRDAALKGTRCRACDNLFAGERERCGACRSDDVFALDLVDALVRQCELTSATVDFVDPIPGLSRVGDVAALLRY